MLNWMERIIRMRKEVPEVGWGDFQVIATRDPAVLILRYDWRNNSVVIVHNLDAKPREVSFATGLPREAGKLLVKKTTATPTSMVNTNFCWRPTDIAGSAQVAFDFCIPTRGTEVSPLIKSTKSSVTGFVCGSSATSIASG
jgi:hypothetical protein